MAIAVRGAQGCRYAAESLRPAPGATDLLLRMITRGRHEGNRVLNMALAITRPVGDA
jgi:hypothetical protein